MLRTLEGFYDFRCSYKKRRVFNCVIPLNGFFTYAINVVEAIDHIFMVMINSHALRWLFSHFRIFIHIYPFLFFNLDCSYETKCNNIVNNIINTALMKLVTTFGNYKDLLIVSFFNSFGVVMFSVVWYQRRIKGYMPGQITR